MLLCFEKEITDLSLERDGKEESCVITFKRSKVPHVVPFSSISWVSPDWFEKTSIPSLKKSYI
jgi:hypothetical protein